MGEMSKFDTLLIVLLLSSLAFCSGNQDVNIQDVRSQYRAYLRNIGKDMKRLNDKRRLDKFRENLNLIHLHNAHPTKLYTLDPQSMFMDEYDEDLLSPYVMGGAMASDFDDDYNEYNTYIDPSTVLVDDDDHETNDLDDLYDGDDDDDDSSAIYSDESNTDDDVHDIDDTDLQNYLFHDDDSDDQNKTPFDDYYSDDANDMSFYYSDEVDDGNPVVHDDQFVDDDMGYLKDDVHDDMLVDDPGYPIDDIILPRNADDDYHDDLVAESKSSKLNVINNMQPDKYDYPYYSDDTEVDDVTDDYVVDDGAGGWYSNGYGGNMYYYSSFDFDVNKKSSSARRKTRKNGHGLNWASRNNPLGTQITPPVIHQKDIQRSGYIVAAISGIVSNVNKNAGKVVIHKISPSKIVSNLNFDKSVPKVERVMRMFQKSATSVARSNHALSRVKIDQIKGSNIHGEAKLLRALRNHGPLVIDICIRGNKQFFFYKKGILDESAFDDTSCDHNDHSVLLTGYGTDKNGIDYWLVQNSWSRSWGENGFARIKRVDSSGTNSKGLFNLASHAVFPTGGRVIPPSSSSSISAFGVVVVFLCCFLIASVYVIHCPRKMNDEMVLNQYTHIGDCDDVIPQVEMRRVNPQFSDQTEIVLSYHNEV